MKILRTKLIFCMVLLLTHTFLFSQVRNEKAFNCGTMDGYPERLLKDERFRYNEERLNKSIEEYIKHLRELGDASLFSDVIRIPVVVHVVYNTASQNISDAQIQSQIDALNRDYRRANADVSTVPGAFSSLPADLRIEFGLARRDPSCNPTTGITRTSTSTTSFTHCDDCGTAQTRNPVKFNSSGGHNGWPSSNYLNIWTCNLSGGLAGYASFPADMATRPSEDGVVMDYEYFGTTGTVSSPYHLGRVCAHEIGHWMNLRHIWGDDTNPSGPGICNGSDFVDDTPNQAGPNSGCPSFPHVSCSNGPDGDLFMDYMDYVVNSCMVMFSQGQYERAIATIATTRASIIASPGLVPPPAIAGSDLWSQDSNEDTGDEPNNASPDFYRSNDIWVRNTNDGFTNQEHLNPVYNPSGPNYVYVRIRNRGCSGSQSADVKLYWAAAASGLSWPAPWDGSVVAPALMGSLIGTKTATVSGGAFQILEFEWNVPNPADYAMFGAQKRHFCLLSRIETSSSSPFGMTFPETSNLGLNVKNNNNIAWKNVTVVSGEEGGEYSIIFGNYSKDRLKTRLIFDDVKYDASVFQWGEVYVTLTDKMYERWKEGGLQQRGIRQISDKVLQILRPGAFIGDFLLDPLEIYPLDFKFVPFHQTNTTQIYKLKAEQIDLSLNQIFGGEIFVIKQVGNSQKIREKEGRTIEIENEEKLKTIIPFSFYPNPSSGKITLTSQENLEGETGISVLDKDGNVRLTFQHVFAEQSSFSLNVDRLEAGFYIIQIDTKEGSYKLKLFIE